MKVTLVAILFAASAFAQAQSDAGAACGPKDAKFATQTVKTQPAPQLETGKSLVYVVEVFEKSVNELGHPTLRVGLDGKWIGADKGDSYLSFTVEPGEHYLCTNWQSSWKRFSKEAAFTSFTAEPGKTYYFRARITELGGATGVSSFMLDLDPVNEDEGRHLVGASSVAVSHPIR